VTAATLHSSAPQSVSVLTRADMLERDRLRIVLATVAINVAAVALLTRAPWSNWRTAITLNLVDNTLLLGFVLMRRDRLLAKLMVFGLAAGIGELGADAWLVVFTRTLDYSPGGGPMLWRSPLWMPFAWEVVAVQFGYLGLRLRRRYGASGLLLIGVLGAVNIPYYEEMARRIHWWRYSGCRMLSFTPWYIIAGEFGIAIVLTLLVRPLRDRGALTALGLGIVAAVGIFVCYALAYAVIE
jgi:hypothetical protein